MSPAAAARQLDALYAAEYLTAAAHRRASGLVEQLTASKRRTLGARIVRRLAVPATPSELAASLRTSTRRMRAMLYALKKQSRVRRLDATIMGARGHAEFLWQRVFTT